MSTTGPAIRYERVAYLDIGTSSDDFRLMGPGFETLDESLNPEIDETTYISDVSATKTLTGYAPEWSFDGTVIKDDDVITRLRGIADGRATGSDAELEVVIFDAWGADEDYDVDANLYAVTVSMESAGSGAGGEKLTFSGSLLGKGDPTAGSFNITTQTWTPDVS